MTVDKQVEGTSGMNLVSSALQAYRDMETDKARNKGAPSLSHNAPLLVQFLSFCRFISVAVTLRLPP